MPDLVGNPEDSRRGPVWGTDNQMRPEGHSLHAVCHHEARRETRGTDLSIRTSYLYKMSLVVRIPVFGVSDQALHKPGCTTTQDG